MKKGKNKILLTGAAGFIGYSLANKLLQNNEYVIGIDDLNNYYNPKLKTDRLEDIKSKLSKNANWFFHEVSLSDEKKLNEICEKYLPNIIIHLAAQAGVRYSIENPNIYIKSNLVGFANVLETCRYLNVDNFIYASSSSVYGANRSIPFNENHCVDHPVSLYAATKKSNELMAHCYSSLYKIPSTGLRFFTVYGPWGRPDMAPMIFAKAILDGKPIKVFNEGNMKRDFTYIDDIVDGITACCYKPAEIDSSFDFYSTKASTSFAPHRVFNIGNSSPIGLNYFIELLEKSLNKSALKKLYPMQKGDIQNTYADISKLHDWVGYQPKTSIEEGVEIFCKWFQEHGRQY